MCFLTLRPLSLAIILISPCGTPILCPFHSTRCLAIQPEWAVCWRARRRWPNSGAPGSQAGPINTASVQGDWHVMAESEAAFEDGTINYLSLPALEIGLRYLATIGMDTIHTRVTCLTGYLLETLQLMKHSNGAPLVQIYGPRTTTRRGGTIALNILTPDGRVVDERLVDRRAVRARISLRTGCFCNPGAGEAAFGITKQLLRERFNKPATNLDEYIAAVGMESAGAIRVSLGLVSNAADIHELMQFVQSFQDSSPGKQDLPPRRQC